MILLAGLVARIISIVARTAPNEERNLVVSPGQVARQHSLWDYRKKSNGT